jgi:hypothetical protein
MQSRLGGSMDGWIQGAGLSWRGMGVMAAFSEHLVFLLGWARTRQVHNEYQWCMVGDLNEYY